MIVQKYDDVCLYRFSLFSREKIVHAVTSRGKGKEENIFSMSLRDTSGAMNRRKLCEILSISLENVVVSRQVHGKHIAIVSKKDRGKGALSHDTAIQSCDAMITREKQTYLMALSGDCPLIGFFDPVKNAIGIAHAGWKGTVLEIASHVVHAMQKEFTSCPQDILAAIAPSIGPCCYQVKDEVLEKVKNLSWGNSCIQDRDGLYYLNLWQANVEQLVASGLKPENIESSQICTGCHLEDFFSYRIEGPHCGHIAFILGME